jgi:hypothetical protein
MSGLVEADIVMRKPMKFSCMRKPKGTDAGLGAEAMASESKGLQ